MLSLWQKYAIKKINLFYFQYGNFKEFKRCHVASNHPVILKLQFVRNSFVGINVRQCALSSMQPR